MESIDESALRALPSLAAPLPEFDTDRAPSDPFELFCGWLQEAITAGVREPHAMTLSTIAADGGPAARTLILKSIDRDGFQFASSALSPKGRQLQADPRGSLTFYWSPLGRQVRIRGSVRPGAAEVNARDFLDRPVHARAIAMAGRQSSVVRDRAQVQKAVAAAESTVDQEPEFVPVDWTRYVLQPDSIEFWQGASDRCHIRLRYQRDSGAWTRELLWP